MLVTMLLKWTGITETDKMTMMCCKKINRKKKRSVDVVTRTMSGTGATNGVAHMKLAMAHAVVSSDA